MRAARHLPAIAQAQAHQVGQDDGRARAGHEKRRALPPGQQLHAQYRPQHPAQATVKHAQ